jgi:hypothetical protein
MKNAVLLLSVILITVLLTGLTAGCISITPQQPEKPPELPPEPSSTPQDTPVTSAPVIISFQTSNEEIAAGESATLTWKVSGATTVNIAPGVGDVPQSGSVKVSPTAGTIYSLTATNRLGTSTRSVGINIARIMTPETIALSEIDVAPNGFILVSMKIPNDIPNAKATYSIKFRRGDEDLVNTIASFPDANKALSYYFITMEPYRTSDAWPIYSINDQQAYVIIIKGNADEPNSDKYNIRLTKSNVYAEVGYINNYKELEDYARLIETRIK